MSLQLLPDPDYTGNHGLLQVRSMQLALTRALNDQNWLEVRRLDKICAVLVDRVIAANPGDTAALIATLEELKDVYSNLIGGCGVKVASKAL